MVSHILAEKVLTELMNTIEETLGLHFTKEKWSDLERALFSIYEEMGYPDIESLADHIIHNQISREELETLVSALTVGETYFFREPNSLNAFEYNILPDLIRNEAARGRRLRIWCAGCATGEEPYTIAMIMRKAIPDIEEWDITILATDINMQFISKALSGIYTKWSFRDVPGWIISKYFIQKNENQFELIDEIKKMVTFNYLNLMEKNYPSILNDTNAMNVIFCRNVLMYFSKDNIKSVVLKLNNSLNEGGFFIVSQTELSDYYFGDFQSIPSSGAIIYKKVSGKKNTGFYENTGFTRALKNETQMLFSPAGESKVLFKNNPLPMEFSLTKETCSDNKPEVKESIIPEIEKAVKLYESGEYDEALNELTKLISAEHGNHEALALLARVYANKGMLDEAVKYCREAVAADKMNPGYLFLLASIYKETGSCADASSTLRKAIYLNPDFTMAYYTLGIIALGQNNKKEAEKNLDTALSLLRKTESNEYIPESEGLPAWRLAGIIESVRMRL